MRVIIEVVVFRALIMVSTAGVFLLYLHCHYSSSSSWQIGGLSGRNVARVEQEKRTHVSKRRERYRASA